MNLYEQFKRESALEIAQQRDDAEFAEKSQGWMNHANRHKYSYHFDWLGRPIIQYPQDILAMQEIIWQVKPDLIIETGIAHGGSIIFSASMLALLDLFEAIETDISFNHRDARRRVLGIDVDIRAHNQNAIKSHPLAHKIDMIQGSSIAPEVIAQVQEFSKDFSRIMVFLDSNHTHEHVLSELEAYALLTSVGSYCVVFDTIIQDLPTLSVHDRPWGPGDNPKTAVWKYLETHPEFEIEKSIQHKLLITVAPDGYLKRVG